jgi:hypothetical protein
MRPQITLAGLLLGAPAIPLWIYVTYVVGSSPVGFVLPPLVLLGITIAVHRVVGSRPNAWAISALIAPILALLVLLGIAWGNSRYR